MKKDFVTAILMTIVTTVLLGLIYPFAVTVAAQILFRDKANGQLIERNNTLIGSRIIGQPFTGAGYFHSRPSAANNGGYSTISNADEGANSGGSNLAATNKKLVDRIADDVKKAQAENPSRPVPIDLVTTSASGLDPHISPAAAEFQIPRVARERGMSEADVRALVDQFTENRQFGFLGEPRVNVLLLNLALDERKPSTR
jgi:K+-transporting ATPase ATPase C chain